jgi:hypothetical protein
MGEDFKSQNVVWNIPQTMGTVHHNTDRTAIL